ncbi:dapdiamide synthesis protein DdaC-like [Ptychodera flava]|uniref:dapdiamide synthesis protein DdaC-like n=1 Tax=Ptychodera flava TaxID=63121 RepID=UPI003969F0FC
MQSFPVFSTVSKLHVVFCRSLLSTIAMCGTKFEYSARELVDMPTQTRGRLAGRKWLPGALRAGSKFPEYVPNPRENFPAFYRANASVAGCTPIRDFAKDVREIIERELHVHGALLFRGLPLKNGNDFSKFMRRLKDSLMRYEGGTAVRHEVAGSVYTASNDPPEYSIEPHNEMAYSDQHPLKVFFFCDVPALPGHGGESVITDVRQVSKKLDSEVVKNFKRLGIRYCRHLPTKKPGGYTSWQQIFNTEDKAYVEQYMAKHERSYRWESDGALTSWFRRPAFRNHPITGEEVWFNQVHSQNATYFQDHPLWAHLDIPSIKYPSNSYYGDGSEIEEDFLQHIREVLWEESVGFQMQKGDVLIHDNVFVGHARLGFTGKRKLLVSLSKD